MRRLEDVIKSPEQVSAEYWQTASDIISNHPGQLRRTSGFDGESEIVCTPSFKPSESASVYRTGSPYRVTRNAAGEGAVFENNFAIAAAVNKGKQYKPGNPLYLIINDNTVQPLLQFNRASGGVQVIGDAFGALEDDPRVISSILSYIEDRMESKQVEQDFNASSVRKLNRKRRTVATIAGAAVLVVGGGIYGLVDWRTDLANEKAANRRAFDERNIDVSIPEPVGPGDLGFAISDPSFIEKYDIPSPVDGDTYSHPRSLTISAGECRGLSKPLKKNGDETLSAISNAPNEAAYIAVDSSGNASVCIFSQEAEDSDSDTVAKYEVAVQISNRISG